VAASCMRLASCSTGVPSLSHSVSVVSLFHRVPRRAALFPYTTLFRSHQVLNRDLPIRRHGVENRIALRIHYGDTHVGELWKVFRSEEHTSELQSHLNLVCRLLLEKKKLQNTESSLSRTD